MENNNEKTYKAGEVMSMLENINGGIKVIGEQHRSIVDRLDSIDGRLDGIDGRLDKIESDLVDIDRDLKVKVDRSEFTALERKLAQA